MAKRKIQKPTRFERMYKVWDYLRKNTDRRHPTSIAKMRKDENINAYIGDKETINRLHIKGIPRIPKKNVANLPEKWSEDFQLKHLNMSFDKPVPVTLRIKSEKCEDNPKKRVRPGYTFLHDWFGDSFTYIRTEKEPPYDDIVRVECSPYGMAHWALQYSELVEVLEPEGLREDIKSKIKALNEKYSL